MRISDWSSDVCSSDLRIVGAVLYGDTADGSWYFDLLKKQDDVSELRDMLIFGQSFASGGGAADPKAAVAALSDDAEICGCNGVTKGQVVSCIAKGAHSLDAVRRSEEHTSELQSLMRISYAVFCLKKKTHIQIQQTNRT